MSSILKTDKGGLTNVMQHFTFHTSDTVRKLFFFLHCAQVKAVRHSKLSMHYQFFRSKLHCTNSILKTGKGSLTNFTKPITLVEFRAALSSTKIQE